MRWHHLDVEETIYHSILLLLIRYCDTNKTVNIEDLEKIIELIR